MEVKVAPHKLIDQPYNIDLSDSRIKLLIGGNGSGKSSVLESIFKTEQDPDELKRIVCYSSGLNESFSKIYKEQITGSRVYRIDSEEDSLNDEIIDSKFKAIYLDYRLSKLLIFFALSLKNDGRIFNYLNNSGRTNYKLKLDVKVDGSYIKRIQNIIKREALDPSRKSIRNTFFHGFLSKLITQYVNSEYDFEEPIRSTSITLESANIPLEFSNPIRLFAFLNWAGTNDFVNLESARIEIEDLGIDSYSDGEFQLMSIYSVLDLFDNENTLFLLDEIDSHVHFENIRSLWSSLSDLEGKMITTSHSADSIIQNEIKNIKLVEKGEIQEDSTANQILDRLEALASGANYKMDVAGKVKYLALVEDYFDWFIFLELCKKKVADFDMNIMQQIHYIKCSNGFNSYADRFGNSKLDWVDSFKQQNTDPFTKSIFLICDRDNLSVNDVLENGLVSDSEATGRRKRIQLRGNKYAYLMSWKRREIENYLLSYTMLNNNGMLANINQHLAQVNQLVQSNACDNQNVQDLDVKTMLQPLYLKDGIQPGNDLDETGVDYNKLSRIIGEIPVDEISQDIENIYNFIKGKL
jgi:energy-coupling factor transporter ATP-binding protein EcfA2